MMRQRCDDREERISVMIVVAIVSVFMLAGCAGFPQGNNFEKSMDCSVYKTIKTKDSFKFQLGYMQISAGADLGMDREEAVNWNNDMHKIIVRYLEACSGYNAGMMTKDEYQQKIQRIALLSKEAQEAEQRIIDGVWERHEKDQENLRKQ
ncbi:MAG: hypothetical protein MRJ96_07590 [Nitrospirales bacterium]|nr:hypothetical protein [Nitrospira sp.]MDR4501295.1 hypothetical protein [Nitrospirales bacterium]